MKKLLLCFLCLLLTLSAFAGCNKEPATPQENETQGETDGASGEEGTEEVDPEAYLYSDLQKISFATDNGPYEFKILNNESNYGLVTIETDTITTAIDSAMFSRNSFVEEQLGIVISETQMEYHADTSAIDTLHESHTYGYDICYNESWQQAPLVLKGVYLPTSEYEDHMDLTKPWWYKDVLDGMTIGDRCYLFAGDLQLMLCDSLWCLAFNGDILNNHQLESPYTLVNNNEWTMEKLYEYTVATEIDGSTERYGIVSHAAFTSALVFGSDLVLVNKDTDNLLVRAAIDDRFVTIFDKIRDWFFVENGAIPKRRNGISANANFEKHKEFGDFNFQQVFIEGNAAFMGGTVGDMRLYLPSSSVSYGIVPIPKYTSTQKQFISYIYSSGALMGVPDSVQYAPGENQLLRVATVLDWMGAYSYQLVKPTYYDIILCGHVSRKQETVDMLNIIFGNDPRGEMRIELDGVYNLGQTGALQVCMMDDLGVKGRLKALSDIIDDTLDKTVKFYTGAVTQ